MKKLLLALFIILTIRCLNFIDVIAVRVIFSFVIFGWFLFLNDFAQKKIFQSEFINGILGHLASMICLLPFYQWKTLQEHKANEQALKRNWIPPLNVLIYSMKNFWNIKRLWNLYPDKTLRKKFILSILAMNIMLLGVIPRVPNFWIKFGPSYFAFLIIVEIYLQRINRRTRLSLNLKQE